MAKLDKYLTYYAEPEAQTVASFNQCFERGLAIPIYREPVAVLERFCDFAEQHSGTLLLLVLNRPDHDPCTEWLEPWLNHDRLASEQCFWRCDESHLHAYQLANDSGVLIIDRAVQGDSIPKKQGVGLARKIGADILYALIQQKKVSSTWLSNTDADALLPDDYFSALTQINNAQHNNAQYNNPLLNGTKPIAACVYPFEHIVIDATPPLPTLLYEFSLHYYVNGLQWAGSPYAYHTIGSIIAIQATHYAQVRGFPKRAGAEDFYLLNKLAKTGSIISLEKPCIKIAARHSTRVPFGTGPATAELSRLDEPLQMPLYHPASFFYLRSFLAVIKLLSEEYANISDTIERVLAQQESIASVDLNRDWLLELADHFALEKALQHSYQHGKTADTRLQHLLHWFDGFKTLKLIHWLREKKLEKITYQDWVQNWPANFMPANAAMQRLIQHIKQARSKELTDL